MDEHLSDSHAGSVDALGDPPMVDLLAELMGSWDEPEAEILAATATVAVAAAEEAPAAASEPVLAVDVAAAVVAAPPAPLAEPVLSDDEILAAMIAEEELVQAQAAAATGLTNLAVSVDALTEVTSPAQDTADAVLPDLFNELAASDAQDVLDSLMSDLANAELPVEEVAPAGVPENAEKYVLFSLGPKRYAVAIHQVIETDRMPLVTRVPHVPEFVRGIINLRGDILSLIDLRTLWGLPTLEAGRTGRLLVVRSNGEQVVTGLVVDDVNGIAPIAPESLAVRDGEKNEKIAPLLRGVYEHQQQSLHVIDLERLFLTPEIQQLTAN